MEKHNRTLGDLFLLIKYPLITEKSSYLYKRDIYTFIVDKSMTKFEIKSAFENFFSIKIVEIKTMNLAIKKKKVGKFLGNKPNYKKIYIKLKKGYYINGLFDVFKIPEKEIIETNKKEIIEEINPFFKEENKIITLKEDINFINVEDFL